MTNDVATRGSTFLPVVVGAMTLSTIQLFAIAVLASDLIDELDLTRTKIGIVGAVSTLVGGFLSPVLGTAIDRLGARRSIVLLMVWAAAGLFLTAVVNSFWSLAVVGGFSGVGQAAANPATNKAIGAAFAPGRRGVIIGIKQSGVQLAIFLAGVTFPPSVDSIGWRAAFVIFGCLALALGAMAWTVLPADAPSSEEQAARASNEKRALPPFVYVVSLYAFVIGLSSGGATRFLPLFANEEAGLSTTTAGLVVALSGLVAMGTRIGWGRAVEKTVSKPGSLIFMAWGGVGVCVLLLSVEAVGAWLLWPTAILLAATMGSWNTVANLAMIDAVDNDTAGRATGLMILGFMFGLAAGAPLVGALVDWRGNYDLAWIVMGGFSVVGALVVQVASANDLAPRSAPR